MFIEPMARRRLLSGVAFADLHADGTLVVVGTRNNDVISVQMQDDSIVAVRGQESAAFDGSQVHSVRVEAFRGNDSISVDVPMPYSAIGAGGSDSLQGFGMLGILDGGEGDDSLAGDNQTILRGGTGNDMFDSLYEGNFETGFEGPIVDYSARDSALVYEELLNDSVTLTVGAGEIDNLSSPLVVLTVRGTQFDDSFVCRDVRLGRGRQFEGLSGDDSFLAGGAGLCAAVGGIGNDTFVTNTRRTDLKGRGELIVAGGEGDDTVTAVFEDDGLSATSGFFDLGNGRDVVDLSDYTGAAFAFFREQSIELALGIGARSSMRVQGTGAGEFFETGGANAVTIEGFGGDDTVFGSERDDFLNGGSGDDMIRGGDGDDIITGSDGNDTLRGGSGNDTLIGGAGKDKLYGDAGDDLLLGRGGSKDRLDGGAGTDAATADVGPSVIDLVLNVEDVN